MQLYPGLKTDVVVVPHHGSVNTLEPDFLESLDADIMLCSCSRSQYRSANNISPNPFDDSHTAKTFYTCRDRAITIFIDKRGEINVITNNK